jgi:hypothetical protein
VLAGGTLTPELREWAEQERMKNHKLQALHNHQKVKKWTKVGYRLCVGTGCVWVQAVCVCVCVCVCVVVGVGVGGGGRAGGCCC